MTQNRFIRRGNDTAMANIVCGIVFCVFTFTYLYEYQDDLLKMEQHVLSNGLTTYGRLIGAVILTILLALAQAGIDTITRKCIKQPALTFLPSAMLLAMLTDISPDVDTGYRISKWAWLAPLTLTVFAALAYASARMAKTEQNAAERKTAFRLIWENVMGMFLLIIFVCSTANTNRTFHDRIKIDNLVAAGKYAEALNVETDRTDTDSSTTMLRAYALSKRGELGERLFEYPLTGGADAILPNHPTVKGMTCNEAEIFSHVARPVKQHMSPMHYLLWARSHYFAKKPLNDYLLCAYLMDKDLDRFARELTRDKDILNKRLPKHYKEALVLYNHLRSTPLVTYHNDVMEADYNDLQTVLKENANPKERKTLVCESYGNTYWYYYLYGEK